MDIDSMVFETGEIDLGRFFGKLEGWKLVPPSIYPTQYSFRDVRGMRAGHLKFVGYLGKIREDRPGRWLCRCDCGRYVVRAAYILSRGKPDIQKCNDCGNADHEAWKAENPL